MGHRVAARVRYNLEQRVCICDWYMKESSYKCPDTTCPAEDIISKLVKKVGTRGILVSRKPLEGNNVLTEVKLDDLSRRLENSSRGSLLRLALQSGVSVGSVWTATKLKHIRP
jgi:hypothetical protein